MKKILTCFLVLIISLFGLSASVLSEREPVGETELKDNMLFINGSSIPAAQLPNQFVYIRVNDLKYYGFDVELIESDGQRIYTITRNEDNGIIPKEGPSSGESEKVYTTDAVVYIDSDIPANVFELENGTVLVQSDELAKYGTYDWSAETHTINITLNNSNEVPPFLPFHNAIGVDDINNIKYGVIVNNTEKKCADIDHSDLVKWLEVYWDFNYERVIAPLSAYSLDGEYIKFWNEDKSRSYIVYPNSGIIAGKYGNAYETHGEIKQNYVWYLPRISNSRGALTSADTNLKHTYLRQVDEVEFKGDNQREFTSNDDIEIPSENLLITENASPWAVPEIEKAAACNLMVYDLYEKYTQPVTRYDFCRLAYRLTATEFEPDSDSRTGIQFAVSDILTERGISNSAKFSDCSYLEVENLASMGIIEGMGDGTFRPDESITREQAAALLYRTAVFLGNKTMAEPGYGNMYSDEYSISDWAKSPVAAITAMGIMQGVSESEFAPKETYTVEQAVATMMRLYECN